MGLGTSEALGTWKFEVNEIWKFVGLGFGRTIGNCKLM
jgi:hypothetical protein